MRSNKISTNRFNAGGVLGNHRWKCVGYLKLPPVRARHHGAIANQINENGSVALRPDPIIVRVRTHSHGGGLFGWQYRPGLKIYDLICFGIIEPFFCAPLQILSSCDFKFLFISSNRYRFVALSFLMLKLSVYYVLELSLNIVSELTDNGVALFFILIV